MTQALGRGGGRGAGRGGLRGGGQLHWAQRSSWSWGVWCCCFGNLSRVWGRGPRVTWGGGGGGHRPLSSGPYTTPHAARRTEPQGHPRGDKTSQRRTDKIGCSLFPSNRRQLRANRAPSIIAVPDGGTHGPSLLAITLGRWASPDLRDSSELRRKRRASISSLSLRLASSRACS